MKGFRVSVSTYSRMMTQKAKRIREQLLGRRVSSKFERAKSRRQRRKFWRSITDLRTRMNLWRHSAWELRFLTRATRGRSRRRRARESRDSRKQWLQLASERHQRIWEMSWTRSTHHVCCYKIRWRGIQRAYTLWYQMAALRWPCRHQALLSTSQVWQTRLRSVIWCSRRIIRLARDCWIYKNRRTLAWRQEGQRMFTTYPILEACCMLTSRIRLV